jgi:hypothetical protein
VSIDPFVRLTIAMLDVTVPSSAFNVDTTVRWHRVWPECQKPERAVRNHRRIHHICLGVRRYVALLPVAKATVHSHWKSPLDSRVSTVRHGGNVYSESPEGARLAGPAEN